MRSCGMGQEWMKWIEVNRWFRNVQTVHTKIIKHQATSSHSCGSLDLTDPSASDPKKSVLGWQTTQMRMCLWESERCESETMSLMQDSLVVSQLDTPKWWRLCLCGNYKIMQRRCKGANRARCCRPCVWNGLETLKKHLKPLKVSVHFIPFPTIPKRFPNC